MPSSANGSTGPPHRTSPRTSARRRADPDPQAGADPEATSREATSGRRLAAEALRWACHAAGLLTGPSGASPLARGALRGLKKRLSKGAAETAIRVALQALAAAGREAIERPSYGKDRPYFCPYEKALGALDFSLRAGFGSLAIPSKLVGVREHQGAIRRLKASGVRFGSALYFVDAGDRIAVATPADSPYDGAVLGYVQAKHEPWVRVLLARSAADADGLSSNGSLPEDAEPPRLGVCLLAVTGDGRNGRLHGVNVAFVRLST